MPREIKSSDDSRKNWHHINANTRAIAAIESRLNRGRAGGLAGAQREDFYLHPFQVYVLPQIRIAPADRVPATDWRTVRVHHGYVIKDGTLVATEGCDDADGAGVTPSEIIVPASTAAYFIWVKITLNAQGLPTAAVIESGTDGWPEFPAPSDDQTEAFHLIAKVDSATDADKKRVKVRQFQFEDVRLMPEPANVGGYFAKVVHVGPDYYVCHRATANLISQSLTWETGYVAVQIAPYNEILDDDGFPRRKVQLGESDRYYWEVQEEQQTWQIDAILTIMKIPQLGVVVYEGESLPVVYVDVTAPPVWKPQITGVPYCDETDAEILVGVAETFPLE